MRFRVSCSSKVHDYSPSILVRGSTVLKATLDENRIDAVSVTKNTTDASSMYVCMYVYM